MGRPFLAPPGIREERKLALRRAFDLTMADPAFLADAAKLRLDVSPIRGVMIEQFLQDAYGTPRPLVQRAAPADARPAGEEREELLHDARKSAKAARYAGESVSRVFGADATAFAEATTLSS